MYVEILIVSLTLLSIGSSAYGVWTQAAAADHQRGRALRWHRASRALMALLGVVIFAYQTASAAAGEVSWARPAGVALIGAGLLVLELGRTQPRGPWAGSAWAAFGVFLRSRVNRAALALTIAGTVLYLW